MVKKPSSHLFIRRFRDKRAGVIMITCLKNRKAYLGHGEDVERLLWHIERRLHHNKWRIPAMQEDWNRYGAQWFRFGVAADFPIYPDEEEQIAKRRVDDALTELRSSVQPAYNERSPKGRQFFLCRHLEKLGRSNISAKDVPVASAIGLRGVFVLTCVKNKRQYVGYCGDLELTMKNMVMHLDRGDHRNVPLQEDWARHGKSCFVLEFCEVRNGDLLQLRKEVAVRVQPEYNVLAEQMRVKQKETAHP